MPGMRRFLLAVGIFLFLLLFVAGGWYMATRQSPAKQVATTPSTTTAPSVSETKPADAPPIYDVKVHFSKHPESDDDPTQTFPVDRTARDSGVATFAMQELLKGPTPAETTRGYFSTARLRDGESTCGGKDFSLKLEDGTARLQFCKPFDHIGSVSDGQAESVIKATLDQFDSITKVIILNAAGDCEFDQAGDNRCLQ